MRGREEGGGETYVSALVLDDHVRSRNHHHLSEHAHAQHAAAMRRPYGETAEEDRCTFAERH